MIAIIAAGSFICTCAWLLYAPVWRRAPAQDFMVFYTAMRAFMEGHLSLIFDGAAFTAQINQWFGDWMAEPLGLHPWVYPPLFLLLNLPLGLLPGPAAYVAFMVASFIALNCAIRCYAPPGWPRWLCAGSLLLSPATAFTLLVGQNGFLTTALLVGGFGLTRRAPLLAGVLLGALACKPQLWLMVPVALIAAREWKVFASSLATIVALALLSLVVFGWEPWWQWLSLMLGQNAQYQEWLPVGRLDGQSAYTEAVLFGASADVARVAQALTTLASAALVWWCFRLSRLPRDLRLAVLLTAVIIGAPHVSVYDAVMVVVAVSLLLCRAVAGGFRFGEAAVVVVAWGVEVLDPPRYISGGLATPFVFCLFLALVIARGLAEHPVGESAPAAVR